MIATIYDVLESAFVFLSAKVPKPEYFTLNYSLITQIEITQNNSNRNNTVKLKNLIV